MISFLEYFKYFAAVLVALSVPACGLGALMPLMFCDSGPIAVCFLMAALIIGIALAQVILLVKGWGLLKQRQRPRRVAAYMIMSVLLLPLAILIFSHIPG